MAAERRASAREPLMLQFALADGTPAVTRNISAHGLYFVVPAGTPLDLWMSFEYTRPESGLRFSAAGEVVRIEPAPEGQTGVAVRWHVPRLAAQH